MALGLVLGCAICAGGIAVKFYGHAAYRQEGKAYAFVSGALLVAAVVVWWSA